MAATADSRNRNTPGSNYPGFKLGTALGEAWLRVLTDQVSFANDTWGQLKTGSFAFGDYARGAATLWESSVRTMADVVRAPFLSGGPQWVNFVFDKEKPALKHTLSLSAQLGEAVELAVTPLYGLDSERVIAPSGISATLPVMNRRRDALEVMITDPLAAKNGRYLGFVYDRRSQGGPPLVVILLTVDR